jgi:hypothetical protein
MGWFPISSRSTFKYWVIFPRHDEFTDLERECNHPIEVFSRFQSSVMRRMGLRLAEQNFRWGRWLNKKREGVTRRQVLPEIDCRFRRIRIG